MSGTLNFRDFIQAMASSVIETQNRIEKYQLINIFRTYFDTDSRPKCIELNVPSMRPGAAPDEEEKYRVPWLPLVPPNTLKVKDVEMSFDVELAGILEQPENNKRKPVDTISVNLGGGSKDSASRLHVTLRVESAEPSDGAMRLMNHLSQTQGVCAVVNNEEPPADDETQEEK